MSLHLYLEVPGYVKTVCGKLADAGHRAFVVGGCVRDRLMGREPHDWDVTTAATPDEVRAVFGDAYGFHVVPTGEKYGTMTVMVHDRTEDIPVEVTTYRSDGNYSDGRRPDKVVFGDSLAGDVERRDFTMNALAYDPTLEELHDYVGGVDAINKLTIDTVGEPRERFKEDGLRVLRMVRFACTLDLAYSSRLQQLVTYNPLQSKLGEYTTNLSAERVSSELFKILGSTDPVRGIKDLAEIGVFERWLPEYVAMKAQQQNRYHRYDVWTHTLETLRYVTAGKSTRNDALLRFAALLHDVAKPVVAELKDECKKHTCGHTKAEHNWNYTELFEGADTQHGTCSCSCMGFEQGYSFVRHEDVGAKLAEDICRRFKLSNEDTHYVTTLVREHLFYYDSTWSDAAVRRFVKRVPVEYIDDLFLMCKADRMAHGYYDEDKHKVGLIEEFRQRCHEQLAYKPPLKVNDLAVSGTDVMEHLGIGPGPAVGVELKRLQELVLEDPTLNEKHLLIRLMRNP